jgi:hypothetical protein
VGDCGCEPTGTETIATAATLRTLARRRAQGKTNREIRHAVPVILRFHHASQQIRPEAALGGQIGVGVASGR